VRALHAPEDSKCVTKSSQSLGSSEQYRSGIQITSIIFIFHRMTGQPKAGQKVLIASGMHLQKIRAPECLNYLNHKSVNRVNI